LFLIFNRPDTTRRVFERIREVRPARLYVAADGARDERGEEANRCVEARAVIEDVDWECEVKTLFRDRNLGCKVAVSEAITWFFEQEEYGIILEDDCLPDPSFFQFCEELLELYKDDTRIGHIGGNCFFPYCVDKQYSYNFSSFAHIWGWATWRRVWQNYDVNFSFWEKYKDDKKMRNSIFNNLREKIYFSSFISDAISGRHHINTWDTQYFFTLRVQKQLSVYPTVNLVANIGLNSENATHTSAKNEKFVLPLSSVSFPLKHPQNIARNKALDEQTVRRNFLSWKRLVRYCLSDY